MSAFNVPASIRSTPPATAPGTASERGNGRSARHTAIARLMNSKGVELAFQLGIEDNFPERLTNCLLTLIDCPGDDIWPVSHDETIFVAILTWEAGRQLERAYAERHHLARKYGNNGAAYLDKTRSFIAAKLHAAFPYAPIIDGAGTPQNHIASEGDQDTFIIDVTGPTWSPGTEKTELSVSIALYAPRQFPCLGSITFPKHDLHLLGAGNVSLMHGEIWTLPDTKQTIFDSIEIAPGLEEVLSAPAEEAGFSTSASDYPLASFGRVLRGDAVAYVATTPNAYRSLLGAIAAIGKYELQFNFDWEKVDILEETEEMKETEEMNLVICAPPGNFDSVKALVDLAMLLGQELDGHSSA